MNNRTLAKPKKNNSTTFAPVFGKQLLDRTVRPESPIDAHDVSNPVFGHNFGNVQVESPSFKQTCPLSLSGPTRCPFGGACHTCPAIQAKLKINKPGDKYEQEADKVAEQVMRMPELQVQRKECFSPDCKEEDKDKILQAKSVGSDGNAQASDHLLIQSVLSSPGQPLDVATRSFMEPRFEQDFSGVRVHTDGKAAESAQVVNARAYTVGQHVVFGRGQYVSETDEGKRLVAHELVHVEQQRNLANGGTNTIQRWDPGPLPSSDYPVSVPSLNGPNKTSAQQRICGPDITTSLSTMLSTVEPWFRGLSTYRKHRSCVALGPFAPLVGVNPVMAWDTRELFLPNTDWLDTYFLHRSCGSPRDARCANDPTRHLCETSSSCGNSVVVNGKCMLAGTSNYALFGKMCRLCHDYTGQWNRWDMRAIIETWKTIDWDDSTPPKEVASAAYDGTFPTLPAATENRRTCTSRCGMTHSGVFNFIWEPYKSR